MTGVLGTFIWFLICWTHELSFISINFNLPIFSSFYWEVGFFVVLLFRKSLVMEVFRHAMQHCTSRKGHVSLLCRVNSLARRGAWILNLFFFQWVSVPLVSSLFCPLLPPHDFKDVSLTSKEVWRPSSSPYYFHSLEVRIVLDQKTSRVGLKISFPLSPWRETGWQSEVVLPLLMYDRKTLAGLLSGSHVEEAVMVDLETPLLIDWKGEVTWEIS